MNRLCMKLGDPIPSIKKLNHDLHRYKMKRDLGKSLVELDMLNFWVELRKLSELNLDFTFRQSLKNYFTGERDSMQTWDPYQL